MEKFYQTLEKILTNFGDESGIKKESIFEVFEKVKNKVQLELDQEQKLEIAFYLNARLKELLIEENAKTYDDEDSRNRENEKMEIKLKNLFEEIYYALQKDYNVDVFIYREKCRETLEETIKIAEKQLNENPVGLIPIKNEMSIEEEIYYHSNSKDEVSNSDQQFIHVFVINIIPREVISKEIEFDDGRSYTNSEGKRTKISHGRRETYRDIDAENESNSITSRKPKYFLEPKSVNFLKSVVIYHTNEDLRVTEEKAKLTGYKFRQDYQDKFIKSMFWLNYNFLVEIDKSIFSEHIVFELQEYKENLKKAKKTLELMELENAALKEEFSINDEIIKIHEDIKRHIKH